MKKKKVSLQRKLELNKETIASLNAAHQSAVVGGLPPLTRDVRCIITNDGSDTCATIPPGQINCVFCQTI